MEEQKRICLGANLYPPDTSLDMLKRVLAVAELVAKSKQPPEDKQQLASESRKKTQSARADIS